MERNDIIKIVEKLEPEELLLRLRLEDVVKLVPFRAGLVAMLARADAPDAAEATIAFWAVAFEVGYTVGVKAAQAEMLAETQADLVAVVN